MQRIGETTGFDNDVCALLAGQLFDLMPHVFTYWVDAEVSTATTGNEAAMFNRIDTNHNRRTGFFCQLDRYLAYRP
ncbi:hypothetical protein D1872_337620 [compost metagenome]